MAPRRSHTRQQSKAVSYCDSVHTLVISPRSSSFLADEEVYTNTRKNGQRASSPLGFLARALAAWRPRTRSREGLRSITNSPSPSVTMSSQETAALMQLLSPSQPAFEDLLLDTPASSIRCKLSPAATPVNSRRASPNRRTKELPSLPFSIAAPIRSY